MKNIFLLWSLLLFMLTPAARCAQDDLFPFILPWDDATATITDLSAWNHKPAGSRGFIREGRDGRLYAGRKQIRFLGVNFCSASALPDRQAADKLAARLAKFGVNLVRFHHLDANWNENVFARPGITTRELSPEALDRFDYFFSRLKAHGIYADINLLVSRKFLAGDGLPAAISQLAWKDQQTPAMFDPAMLGLQKEYAAHLLQRVNPYTQLAYTEDPAVAFIEILNEHGLIHAWHLGSFDRLPADFQPALATEWNAFLKAKYGSQAALRQKWISQADPGPEMLRNPGFAQGLKSWTVERHAKASAQAAVQNLEIGRALAIQVERPGVENWHIQFNQPGLKVEAGKPYTLRFKAKADKSTQAEIMLMQAQAPWSILGFLKVLDLSPAWQAYEFVFQIPAGSAHARLNIARLNSADTAYAFADFSLKPGGTLGLLTGEDVEQGTVPLLRWDRREQRTAQAQQDWENFLWRKEDAYWSSLRDYLKTVLKAKARIVGTVIGNSTPVLMQKFDALDSHAYWQHPQFVKEWGSPWQIRNSSMAGEKDGGTISSLSVKRVVGRPFMVSEYNHPAPNSFDSEAFLFLSAYAAFQDWDAIVPFTYADGSTNWSEDHIENFFDLDRHPGKMASLLAAACWFRRGDLAPGKQLVTVPLSREDELRLLPAASAWRLVDAEHQGLPRETALLHRIGILPAGSKSNGPRPPAVSRPKGQPWESDTGELCWNPDQKILTVNSPRSKAVIGYGLGKTFSLGNITIKPLTALQSWSAITLTVIQGKNFQRPKNLLITAAGLVMNTGMEWLRYPDAPAGFPPPADEALTLRDWGKAPTLIEGVGCEFLLPYAPGRVKVFALDGRGGRKSSLPVTPAEGKARFQISSQAKTIWYEIEVK